MQCPAQQFAFDTLKQYPLEEWVKYKDHVYILDLLDGDIIILFGNYGYVPFAYKCWIKSDCSELLTTVSLDIQISIILENNNKPLVTNMKRYSH